MKKKILTTVALSIILLNACKKDAHDDDHKHNHDSVPKITINDPKKAEYETGDTAFVNAVITDEHELEEAKCYFITQPQNDTLWHLKRHSHSKSITFNSFFVIGNLPDGQKVDFIVVAENESGKTATAKHSFEVHEH